jgi:hypothetical protein
LRCTGAAPSPRPHPQLRLSQPTVTAQIRAMETQLGQQLFRRLPRGVAPTSVADELAGQVAVHVDALSTIAERGLAPLPAGHTGSPGRPAGADDNPRTARVGRVGGARTQAAGHLSGWRTSCFPGSPPGGSTWSSRPSGHEARPSPRHRCLTRSSCWSREVRGLRGSTPPSSNETPRRRCAACHWWRTRRACRSSAGTGARRWGRSRLVARSLLCPICVVFAPAWWPGSGSACCRGTCAPGSSRRGNSSS